MENLFTFPDLFKLLDILPVNYCRAQKLVIDGLEEMPFPEDDFHVMDKAGFVVSADLGGLILGPEYIPVIHRKVDGAYVFRNTKHWQGWQFVLNEAAVCKDNDHSSQGIYIFIAPHFIAALTTLPG